MKTSKRKATVAFSAAEIVAIQRAASAVWDEVQWDIFTALAEEGRRSISRAEVIELALDAGRAEDRLRARAKKEPDLLTPDFFKRLDAASYDQLIAVVKSVFHPGGYSA